MGRFILASALALMTLPAMAGELDAFVAAKDGATACWSRLYDAKHLSAHPDQQVKAMSLAVTYMAATADYAEQYVFRMEAELRGGKAGQASGPCYAQDGKMWCGVECDGGGVLVGNTPGDKVLVDLAYRGTIWMSSSCGEDDEGEGFALDAGLDDKTFLLSALPASSCQAVTFD